MARRHSVAAKVGALIAAPAIGGLVAWGVYVAQASATDSRPFLQPVSGVLIGAAVAGLLLLLFGEVRGTPPTRRSLTSKQRRLVVDALTSGTALMEQLRVGLRRDMPDSDLREWGIYVSAALHDDVAKWSEYATALSERISPEHGALFGDLARLSPQMPPDIQARVEKMEPVSRQRVTQLWDDLGRSLDRLKEFLA